MGNPVNILEKALVSASANLSKSSIKNKGIRTKVEYVCRQLSNGDCFVGESTLLAMTGNAARQ